MTQNFVHNFGRTTDFLKSIHGPSKSLWTPFRETSTRLWQYVLVYYGIQLIESEAAGEHTGAVRGNLHAQSASSALLNDECSDMIYSRREKSLVFLLKCEKKKKQKQAG